MVVVVVVVEGVVLLVVVGSGTTTRTRRFLLDKVLAVAAVGGLVSHSQPQTTAVFCVAAGRGRRIW